MTTIEDALSEYQAMRPRYRELSAIIADYVKNAPASLSDEDLAAKVGWQIETISKFRHPAARVAVRERRELTDRQETVLSYISREWFPTKEIISAVSGSTGLKPVSVNNVLRQLDDKGKIESKTRKGRMYGRSVTLHSHYRLVTEG